MLLTHTYNLTDEERRQIEDNKGTLNADREGMEAARKALADQRAAVEESNRAIEALRKQMELKEAQIEQRKQVRIARKTHIYTRRHDTHDARTQ